VLRERFGVGDNYTIWCGIEQRDLTQLIHALPEFAYLGCNADDPNDHVEIFCYMPPENDILVTDFRFRIDPERKHLSGVIIPFGPFIQVEIRSGKYNAEIARERGENHPTASVETLEFCDREYLSYIIVHTSQFSGAPKVRENNLPNVYAAKAITRIIDLITENQISSYFPMSAGTTLEGFLERSNIVYFDSP